MDLGSSLEHAVLMILKPTSAVRSQVKGLIGSGPTSHALAVPASASIPARARAPHPSQARAAPASTERARGQRKVVRKRVTCASLPVLDVARASTSIPNGVANKFLVGLIKDDLSSAFGINSRHYLGN